MEIAQMMVIATYVLFKVTTCLYLSPQQQGEKSVDTYCSYCEQSQ